MLPDERQVSLISRGVDAVQEDVDLEVEDVNYFFFLLHYLKI
jgi:hypothetical protein